jgi:hypothetical protein
MSIRGYMMQSHASVTIYAEVDTRGSWMPKSYSVISNLSEGLTKLLNTLFYTHSE